MGVTKVADIGDTMLGLNNNCRLLFELGYVPDSNPSLSFNIHERLLNSFEIDYDEVDKKVKRYGFGRFSDFDGNFGFDDAFQRVSEQRGCVKFHVSIPKAVTIHDPLWKQIQAAVQSIAMFTELARHAYGDDEATKLEKRQLISLYVIAEHDRGVYGVAGDYSHALCNYLDNMVQKDDLENIERAMEQTYSYIWGRPRCGPFLAYLHEGGCLTLQCPSNCVVAPRSMRLKNRGVEFDSTEVVHGAEVLVLLSGISALCQMAGREIYGSSF